MNIAGTECARARESVSADLDRELQELDRRRLQAHLRACADCSTWAEHVKATTNELRATPLEAPAVRFALPQRARTWRVSPALAVGSLAALVAVSLGTLHGALGGGRATTSAPRATKEISAVIELQHRLLLDNRIARQNAFAAPHGPFYAW